MRIVGLLSTFVMASAVLLGVMAHGHSPVATTSAGDVSQCLIPMGTAVPPLVGCSDHPSWSGLDRPPDPQWTARRAQ